MTEEPFPEDYDAEPPTPAGGWLAGKSVGGDVDDIPDGLFPDEHVAVVNGLWLVRAGIECPNCGGNVFLHPKSIQPRDLVQCYNCSAAGMGAWWVEKTLDDYADTEVDS